MASQQAILGTLHESLNKRQDGASTMTSLWEATAGRPCGSGRLYHPRCLVCATTSFRKGGDKKLPLSGAPGRHARSTKIGTSRFFSDRLPGLKIHLCLKIIVTTQAGTEGHRGNCSSLPCRRRLGTIARCHGFVGAALQGSAARLEGTKKEVTQQTGKTLRVLQHCDHEAMTTSYSCAYVPLPL